MKLIKKQIRVLTAIKHLQTIIAQLEKCRSCRKLKNCREEGAFCAGFYERTWLEILFFQARKRDLNRNGSYGRGEQVRTDQAAEVFGKEHNP